MGTRGSTPASHDRYNSLDDEFLVAWVGRDPTVPGEDEIYGRILDGTARPRKTVRRLSTVSGTTAPTQPVLGYSPSVNQYLLAYIAPPLASPNNPVGQREVLAQVVSATGVPSGNPERISTRTQETSTTTRCRTRRSHTTPSAISSGFVWTADDAVEGDFEVQSRRVSSSLIDPGGLGVLHLEHGGGRRRRSRDRLSSGSVDRYAIVWEGAAAGGEHRDLRRGRSKSAVAPSSSDESQAAGTNSAVKPSIASNGAGSEALVAFTKNDVGEGPEVFTQRLSAAGPSSRTRRTPGSRRWVRQAISRSASFTTFKPPRCTTRCSTAISSLGRPTTTSPAWSTTNSSATARLSRPTAIEVGERRLPHLHRGPGRQRQRVDAEDGGVRGDLRRRAWMHAVDGRRQPPAARRQRGRALRPAGRRRRRPRRLPVPDRLQRRQRGDPARARRTCSTTASTRTAPAPTPRTSTATATARPARPIATTPTGDRGRAQPTSLTTASTRTARAPTPSTSIATSTARSAPATATTPSRRSGPARPTRRGTASTKTAPARTPSFPTLTSGVLNKWDVTGSRFTLAVASGHATVPEGLEGADPLLGQAEVRFKTKSLKAGKVRRGASTIISSLSSKHAGSGPDKPSRSG